MAEKDVQDKLSEIDKKFDVSSIRKHYKIKLLARINKGEIGLLPELEQLEKLERGEMPSPNSAIRHPQSAIEDDYGIPENLRVKRRLYTMTPEALDQRRKASKSKNKSAGMRANKNAWKTGEHVKGFIRQIFRPCMSTCENFKTCAVIANGETEPGDLCLDKVQFLRTLNAIDTALQTKKLDDLNSIMALRIAGGLEVLERLQRDILEDGTVVKSEKWDKEGALLGYELKNHPALPFLAKLMETLNTTPQDMMVTPMAVKKMKTEEKKAKGLAGFINSIGKNTSDEEEAE